MSKPIPTPASFAAIIADLGGRVVPADTFQFEIPLGDVREIVPRLHGLGVSVKVISQQIDRNPTKALYEPQTIARLGLFHRTED